MAKGCGQWVGALAWPVPVRPYVASPPHWTRFPLPRAGGGGQPGGDFADWYEESGTARSELERVVENPIVVGA